MNYLVWYPLRASEGMSAGFVVFDALLRDALPRSVIDGNCEPVAARLSALATG
jgi:hypothetical protein